ncbi:MAG: EF-hand domain-containing protein [Rhodospirillales bacterium]|nr:EF-hand domain-containing protein [Rhodospirillales bacterium]
MKFSIYFVGIATLAVAVGISGVAGPGMLAFAQQGDGGGGQDRVIQFQLADLDGDGRVSADEAAVRHEETFAIIDANDDDTLSIEEYLAVRFGGGPYGPGLGPHRAEMDKRKRARFNSMDTDGDGIVRKSEFLAAGEEQHKAANTDGDGKISIWEYRAARRF